MQKKPLAIQHSDLSDVLSMLGDKPLKIIVPELWENEKIKERPAETVWKAEKDGGRILKDVMLNEADRFQLSIATAATRQDFHIHSDAVEIYICNKEITIEYGLVGEKPSQLTGTVLIVPPGVAHYAHLNDEVTIVVQCSASGKVGVKNDKHIVFIQSGLITLKAS